MGPGCWVHAACLIRLNRHQEDDLPTPRTDAGNAIRGALISPNEADSNFEPANVVDGLFAIARAVGDLADAIRQTTAASPAAPTITGGNPE